MGDIIDLRGRLIPIEDDELIENLARFADGTLSEAAVKSRNQGTTSTMKIGRPRARRTTSDGRRSKNVGLRRRKRVRQRVSVRTRRACDAELPSIASLTTVQLPGCGMLHRRARSIFLAGLLPVSEHRRQQIADDPPCARLNLDRDRHAGRQVNELVFHLHLCAIKRYARRVVHLLALRFTASRLSAKGFVAGFIFGLYRV